MTLRILFLAAAMLAAMPAHAQEEQSYEAATAATNEVASAYFDAYVARDWDWLEPMLADNANFKDPTATLVFGGVGAPDKAAMMTLFREGYSSITEMSWQEDRRIMAGNIAVFEGTLSWTARHRGDVLVTAVMPFATIVTVEDGKIVEHRDYGDYSKYLEARAKAFPDE